MSVLQQLDLDGDGGQATSKVAPFQIRGRFFTAIVLQVRGGADAAFYAALDTKLAQAPHFFTNAPFVLDLDKANGLSLSGDFVSLVRELRARKLTVIGVQNGTIEQNRAALTAGLITLQGGRDVPPEGEKRAEAVTEAAVEASEASSGSLLVTEPVRSGQRIFADSGDLIVVASVGS